MTLPGNMEAAGVIINKEEEIPEPKVFVVLYIFYHNLRAPSTFSICFKGGHYLVEKF